MMAGKPTGAHVLAQALPVSQVLAQIEQLCMS